MLYVMYHDEMNVWFINACEKIRDKYYIKEVSTTKEHKESRFVASNMQSSASGKVQRSVKRIIN